MALKDSEHTHSWGLRVSYRGRLAAAQTLPLDVLFPRDGVHEELANGSE